MRKLGLAFVVFVILGTACSSGEGGATIESPPASSTAAASPASSAGGKTVTFTTETFTLDLKADNDNGKFYFDPQFIQAPGASTVTVNLKNVGSVTHNFSMDSPKESHDVEAGKTVSFTIKLGVETRYEFYCKYHKSSGMTGAFELH